MYAAVFRFKSGVDCASIFVLHIHGLYNTRTRHKTSQRQGKRPLCPCWADGVADECNSLPCTQARAGVISRGPSGLANGAEEVLKLHVTLGEPDVASREVGALAVRVSLGNAQGLPMGEPAVRSGRAAVDRGQKPSAFSV